MTTWSIAVCVLFGDVGDADGGYGVVVPPFPPSKSPSGGVIGLSVSMLLGGVTNMLMRRTGKPRTTLAFYGVKKEAVLIVMPRARADGFVKRYRDTLRSSALLIYSVFAFECLLSYYVGFQRV